MAEKEVDFTPLVRVVGETLACRRMTLAVMESCTGGRLASAIADVPGCGDYFLGAIVSYATSSKIALGVAEETIRDHGVVSPETAKAMAEVARSRLGADVGVAITGVAGPEPQDGVDVGKVYLGVADSSGTQTRGLDLGKTKPEVIKNVAVEEALHLLREVIAGIDE